MDGLTLGALLVEVTAAALGYGARLTTGSLQSSDQRRLDTRIGRYRTDSLGRAQQAVKTLLEHSTDSEQLSALLRSTDLQQALRIHAHAIRTSALVPPALRLMYVRAARLYVEPAEVPRTVDIMYGFAGQHFEQVISDQHLKSALTLDSSTVVAHLMQLQLERLVDWLRDLAPEAPDERLNQLLNELRHRQSVASAFVRLPDFTRREVQPLTAIYVEPEFDGFYATSAEIVAHLSNRVPGGVVVLGSPGAGKTTLSNHICVSLCNEDRQSGNVAACCIVILREVEARADRGGVADVLAGSYRKKYQMMFSPAEWDRALRHGELAVIFDGLDEILDVSRRSEYSQMIEGFVHAYPLAPVLVTCREQGYEAARLQTRYFRDMRIRPFSDDRIAEYADRWFALSPSVDESRSTDEQRDDFLREVATTGNLRRNPLMLALLCMLYGRVRSIPENLSDVYKACAELLFEDWDAHRKIPTVGINSDRLRRLLGKLAHWMYVSDIDSAGVVESDLVRQCTDLFVEMKVEDREAAAELAASFVEQLAGRSWVFTDVGALGSQERRYAFAHRSFLEYFVAQDFRASLSRGDDELPEFLELVIDDAAYLVGVMTLQAMGLDADDLLERLLEELKTDVVASAASDRLEFISECVVQVDLHSRVVALAVRFVIERTMLTELPVNATAAGRGDLTDVRFLAADRNVARLLDSRRENRAAVLEALLALLRDEPDVSEMMSLALTLISSSEGTRADSRDFCASVRQIVTGRLDADKANLDSIHVAALFGLLDVGWAGREHGRYMMSVEIESMYVLERLISVLAQRYSFNVADEVALETLMECVHAGEVVVSSEHARRACLKGVMGDARDFSYLHLESFSFEYFTDEGRAALLGSMSALAIQARSLVLINRLSRWIRSLILDVHFDDADALIPDDSADLRRLLTSEPHEGNTSLWQVACSAFTMTRIEPT